MSKKNRLIAIAVITAALILAIIRALLDFSNEGTHIAVLIASTGSAAAWAFCLIANLILYKRHKDDKN